MSDTPLPSALGIELFESIEQLEGAPEPRISDYWRFYLAQRYPNHTVLSELNQARSRKLVFDLYNPTTFDFTIDGRVQQINQLAELQSDILAYRWNGQQYAPMFRGTIATSTDTISESTHTVTMQAVDYLGMLNRRFLSAKYKRGYPTQVEQSLIVQDLLNLANAYPSGAGFTAGAFTGQNTNLGIVWGGAWNAANTARYSADNTGQVRQRQYDAGAYIGTLLDELSKVINGFDYAFIPYDATNPSIVPIGELRIWYPNRGTLKSYIAEWGSTVSSLTRSVQTTEFGNMMLAVGGQDPNGVADPDTGNTPNIFYGYVDPALPTSLLAERSWGVVTSWSDVSIMATLQQNGAGEFNVRDQVVPNYTLTMTPGLYEPSDFWIGDTIRLIVHSGRLNVDTNVRVLSIEFDVDDDGVEQIQVTVGRTLLMYSTYLKKEQRRVERLEGR